MSADLPTNYVDGGYRDSLLNTGAERLPIIEMKGGLRAGGRRHVNRLRGDQRRIGGDIPAVPPPSEESHNIPPGAPAPSEESHNIPPKQPESKPIDFFAPKITKEEFYDSASNMLMTYEDFMSQLDQCGTLLGQLTVKCTTIKEIMYKILLYRLANMIQLELGAEGIIGASAPYKPRDYTADDLLVILRRLHELLEVQPTAIKGDVSDILERLNGLIGLLGSIRTLTGPERTLASPALDLLAELQRLLEVLDISKKPAPTSVPDTLSILEQLRTLLSEVPDGTAAHMPAVLDQLNGLLGLLGQVAPAAQVPDIISSLNTLLEPLNVTSTSTLPSSNTTMVNELYNRLQGLLTLLLSVEPRDGDAGVLNTLERLSQLLQGVRTQVTAEPASIDGVAVLEQISQIRRLLENIPPQATPIVAASVQALLTQLDGLQRLVGMATVRGIQRQIAQVTDPSQVTGMLNTLERLVTLLGNVNEQEVALAPAPAPVPTDELSDSMKNSINDIIKSSNDKEDIYDTIKRIAIRTLNVKNNLIEQISAIAPNNVSNIIIEENNLYNSSNPGRKLTIQEREERISKLQKQLNNYSMKLLYNNVSDFNNMDELVQYINACLYFNSFLVFLTKKTNKNIGELTSIKSIIDFTVNPKLKIPLTIEEKLE
jgi:hypothetical protein